MAGIFLKIFHLCETKKWLLGVISLIVLLCIGGGISKLRFADNLTEFIPNNSLHLKDDLNLVQQIPSQRQILISLHKTAGTDKQLLIDAGKKLSAKLQPPFFIDVVSDKIQDGNFNPLHLRDIVPALFDRSVAVEIAIKIEPENIQKKLEHEKQQLFGLGAFSRGQILQEDPLEFYQTILPKMSKLNSMSRIRMRHGLFMNEAEDSVLIIVNSDIETTDSTASEALAQELNGLLKDLPVGIDAVALGSQLYSSANSSIIKSDILKVSIIGTIGLLIITLFFLRSVNIFPILLAPILAYGAGAAAIGFCWQPTLAMVFGFAPILLGISIDYALHFYYVYNSGTESRSATIGHVCQPILISTLSTTLAFSLLLFSSVNGLKQLALFIVTGLVVTMLYTMVVLPHLLRRKRSGESSTNTLYSSIITRVTGTYRAQSLAIVLIVTVLSCLGASQVAFQNHIREMGVRPENLLKAEERINATWGKKTDSVMVFSAGSSVDEAVTNAFKSQTYMKKQGFAPTLSLLDILPPRSEQHLNQKKWQEFLATDGSAIAQNLMTSATDQGFTESSFTPFLEFLARTPQDIDYQSLMELGLAPLFSQLYFVRDTGEHIILTIYPKDADSIIATSQPHLTHFSSRIISMDEMGRKLGTGLADSFGAFILLAIGGMAVFLLFMQRSIPATLVSLSPAIMGLIFMAATLHFLNIHLGIFALAGALLVIGHGVDYGVYIHHYQEKKIAGTPTAIFVSGLTSLTGFGALIMASHPTLHDMGISVFSGVFMAMITALFIIPLMQKRKN